MIYSESDLIVPALVLLAEHPEDGLTTSQLIQTLQAELDVSEEDLRILSGRKDTYFSQKVRNLVSHRTLVNKGLATYEPIGKNGLHKITDAGQRYIINHDQDYSYLINSGFSEKDRESIIKDDFKGLIIEEGYGVPVPQGEKPKRSQKLTRIARKHYMVDGKLTCRGCGFTFNDFYGETAKNYIEIHHLKPIFAYDDGDIAKSLEAALDNVRPLCANCHRMAHRDASHVLSIKELNELVKANGTFEPLS